ncbi:MAG: hypothetical protein COA61_000515 [Zetaproteobacteria bacterium]|nr:hypothetical protein [Zetaproteobacteria bacterium]
MTYTYMRGVLLSASLLAASLAYADGNHTMSDTQHQKTMGGMHHPASSEGQYGESGTAVMGDTQHRKTMTGMKHQHSANEKDHKKASKMSDAQHRKTMGGMHHSD